jgi:hypothetical protein
MKSVDFVFHGDHAADAGLAKLDEQMDVDLRWHKRRR